MAGQAPITLDSLAQIILADTPFQLAYRYSITADDFEQTEAGTLYVAEQAVFRLDLFDKVYGSDGSSLYLHDTNTRQTVIDSLRWGDLHIWLRLLTGNPPEDLVLGKLRRDSQGQRLEIRDRRLLWRGELLLENESGSIRQVRIVEASGWRHLIELQPRIPWQSNGAGEWVRLEDLPGKRMDLR